MLFQRFKQIKARVDELESKCEDLSAKYVTEFDIKKYLANKLKEMEGSQIRISAEIIQKKKTATVINKKNKQIANEKAKVLEESNAKLEKENSELKKIISRKIKSMAKKLDKEKLDNKKLIKILQALNSFFTESIRYYLS